MATSDSPLNVPNVTLAVARGPAALVDANFANGNTLTTFDKNTIGFAWGDQAFTSVGFNAELGANALNFNYSASPPPNPLNTNAWSEARFELNQQFEEIWTRFELYIPANFKVRNLKVIVVDDGQDISGWQAGDIVVGGAAGGSPEGAVWGVDGQTLYLLNAQKSIFKDGYWSGVTLTNTTRGLTATVAAGAPAYQFGSNNKFHTLWSGNYSGSPATGGGGTLDVEYNAPLDPAIGGDYEDLHLTCKSTEVSSASQTENRLSSVTPIVPPIDVDADPGNTITFDFHWKRATTAVSGDGVCEVFKNQKLIYGRYDFPNFDDTRNYFERGYLLGYANSGFDEDTTLAIKRFQVFSKKPFPDT